MRERICAWCGIELWWWRQVTFRLHCRRCESRLPSYANPPYGHHARIGMKEKSPWTRVS